MCLSLSFSNTRVHARDRNAHRDAGGCRRFQDSSPSRSTLPGRKQRRVTPIDTDSLGPRSGFLHVTSRCTFPCSFCSRPRLRPHGRGRRFTQPRGRDGGVGRVTPGPGRRSPSLRWTSPVRPSRVECALRVRCPTLRASVVVTAARIVEAAPPCVTAHSACFGPVALPRSSSAVSPAALLPWDHLLPGGARSSPVFSHNVAASPSRAARCCDSRSSHSAAGVFPSSLGLTFNILIVSCLRVIFLGLILLGVL